jgi:hypothetical protein
MRRSRTDRPAPKDSRKENAVTSLIANKNTIDFKDLRNRSGLDVFTPDDLGYDSVRASWNTVFSHRPLAVVVPVTASAVVETVRFARANGLSIAIQSTGHGPTREAHEAILINMARMTEIDLDVDRPPFASEAEPSGSLCSTWSHPTGLPH